MHWWFFVWWISRPWSGGRTGLPRGQRPARKMGVPLYHSLDGVFVREKPNEIRMMTGTHILGNLPGWWIEPL